MSCSYDIHCLDCKSSVGLDWNHAGNELARALTLKQGFKDFLVLLDALSTDGCWRLADSADGAMQKVGRFFNDHDGHQIVVKDEYGKIFNACAKEIQFGCGHHHYCGREPNHDGECKR